MKKELQKATRNNVYTLIETGMRGRAAAAVRSLNL